MMIARGSGTRGGSSPVGKGDLPMTENNPPKAYILNAEPGRFRISGSDARLIQRTISEAVKRSWPWISVYAVVTAFGIGASYFTNGWVSVALSTVVAAVTLIVGYLMLQKVITITIETR
jgi:hypothetical protein